MNAAYALTQPTFKYYHNEIRLSNPEAGRWIDNVPVEKWTRSSDNGQRWGHMTTNLIESMNGVFKGIRNLPITALVKSTYFRMAAVIGGSGTDCFKAGSRNVAEARVATVFYFLQMERTKAQKNSL